MVYHENGELKKDTTTKVAIACQGGGAQTAFTAGALKKILKYKAKLKKEKQIEIIGFSGTSGGAICAALAWYGMLKDYANDDFESLTAIDWLDNFWNENSVNNFFLNKKAFEIKPWYSCITNSYILNQLMLTGGTISHSLGVFTEFNPYLFPDFVNKELNRLLAPYENFQNAQEWKDIIKKKNNDLIIPYLLIGAANVNSGEFEVFHSDLVNIDNKMILASGAIPTITHAVEIENEKYWDGLYSQNPPIRNFLGSQGLKNYEKNKKIDKELDKKKPDEIWIIRINPKKCEDELNTLLRIKDRQNELSGNLSLEQEIYFIKKINEMIPRLKEFKFKYVKMEHDGKPLEIGIDEKKIKKWLNLESKFNRNHHFITELMKHGEEQAEFFLEDVLER